MCREANCEHECNQGNCVCRSGYILENTNKCREETACEKAKCEFNCKDDQCYCEDGYNLNSDKRTCSEGYNHKCQRQYGCEYSCIDDTNTCKCKEGFYLNNDEKTCTTYQVNVDIEKTGIYIVKNQATYEEALKKCLINGSVLLENTNEEITKLIQNKNEKFWINSQAKDVCSVIVNDKVASEICASKLFYICERKNIAHSPYKFQITKDDKGSYARGKKRCMHAQIKSIEDIANIYRASTFQNSKSHILQPLYFDLHYRSDDKKYIYSDGTETYLTRWANNEPNHPDIEKCVALIDTEFHDVTCERVFDRICQIPNQEFQAKCKAKNCPDGCLYRNGIMECDCAPKFRYNSNDNICLPINDCSGKTHSCSHICMEESGSLTCLCPKGLFLKTDNTTCHNYSKICEVVDHGCQHNCLAVVKTFKCECRDGYKLNDDKKTCSSIFDLTRYIYHRVYDYSKYSHDEAQNKCEETKSDLTTISHLDEQNHVVNVLKQQPGIEKGKDDIYWIGLNDIKIEGDFRWKDGSKTNFTYWRVGEPNGEREENCVGLALTDGKWIDIPCGSKLRGFICRRKEPCYDYCKNNGECRVVDYKAVCSCKPGYTGIQCLKDENECELNAHQCQYKCKNTLGSYECECPIGFTLATNQRDCYDKNLVCQQTDHKCDQLCVEEDNGKYHCACNKGYTLNSDSKNCSDVNECSTDNVCGAGKCINSPGTYHCECEVGYDINPNGGKCVVYSSNNIRYFISNRKVKFADAQTDCKKRNGYLTGMTGPKEIEYLSKRLDKSEKYWIGIHKSNKKWNWMRGSLNYRNWADGEPNIVSSEVTCTSIQNNNNNNNGDYVWYDEDCSYKFYYICRLEKVPVVPEHSYFHISTDKATWEGALHQCRLNEGQLVNIRSEEEQKYIEKIMKFKNLSFWIGVEHQKSASYYSWSNKFKVTGFTNFESINVDNTTTTCGLINQSKQYKWHMTSCNESNHYICRTPFFQYGAHKFYISDTRMSHDAARGYCASVDGYLMSFANEYEDRLIDIALLNDEKYWIGYYKKNNRWSWLDKSRSTYSNWKPDHHVDSNCVVKAHSGNDSKWEKFDCTDYAYALCKVNNFKIGSYKYIYSNQLLSWAEANENCKTNLAVLTSITSNEVEQKLLKKAFPAHEYWLGLNKLDNPSITKWLDGSQVTYNRFGSSSSGNCAWFSKASNQWSFDGCNEIKNHICKRREYPLNNYNYHFVNTPKTWLQAQQSCWKQGGELTSILNVAENTLLDEMKDHSQEYWIGMNDRGTTGDFVWNSGGYVRFLNFANNQRSFNEHCVYMSTLSSTWKSSKPNVSNIIFLTSDLKRSKVLGYVNYTKGGC